MPIPVLRAEVKRLVDEVRDTLILNSVLAFLRGDQDELLWRSVLSARAERVEADFAAGRVHAGTGAGSFQGQARIVKVDLDAVQLLEWISLN